MKRTEEAMDNFMEEVVGEKARLALLELYLSSHYPLHHDELHNPPFWVQQLYDEPQDHDFEHPNGPTKPKSLVDFWRQGGDLAFITYTAPGLASGGSPMQAVGTSRRRPGNHWAAHPDTSANVANAARVLDHATWTNDRRAFFEEICGSRTIPPSPTTDRGIYQLLQNPSVWNMSKAERDRLNAYLNQAMLEGSQPEQLEEFERLKERHREATMEWKEIQNKVCPPLVPCVACM